jgi:GT2 family glycosyltransferase
VADVTVITASYSMERWRLTLAAVESVLAQTVLPREIILPVDHNPELFNRLTEHWASANLGPSAPSIVVVESAYDGHLGAAATTAAELASSKFLAFLDDDAAAEPDWLQRLLAAFEDRRVLAVGGAPQPIYGRPRPPWFPQEFDWVFGCAYAGLPTRSEPILHLIGTTMAVRRSDFLAVGGVHSNDHGDMELSHKLLGRVPGGILLYEPEAIVRHFVHPNRLTWAYFWRRCFFVNRGKVAAMHELGTAGHLRAERGFALRVLTRAIATNLVHFLRGDTGGLKRALAICAGLALAGAGYATGTFAWSLGRRPHPGSTGWVGHLRSSTAESSGVLESQVDVSTPGVSENAQPSAE